MDDKTALPPSFFDEAANSETAPARLKELATYTILHPLLAANPATPAGTLEKLKASSDGTVRRAIANNPNANIQTLDYLAAENPEALLNNPILPMLNITEPEFIKRLGFLTWASLLRFENPTGTWLKRITRDKNYQWRQPAIWKVMQLHVSLIDNAQQSWKSDAHTELRQFQHNLPAHGASYSTEELHLFFLFMLLFPWCASMLQEEWINAAQFSPRLTAQALTTSMEVRDKTMAILASTQTIFILRQVARSPRTPVTTLANMAMRHLEAIPCAVASNPKTPAEIILKLLSSDNNKIRRIAISHATLKRAEHEILALDDDEATRAALAALPRLDTDLLIQLASDPAAPVRAAAARNVKATQDILQQLSLDTEATVRATVAGNPRLSGDLQSAFLTDPEISVRASLGGNAHLSAAHAIQLTQDSSISVRKYLAANPRLPAQFLAPLLQTEIMEIWQGIARHPQARPEMLTLLAQRGNIHVRVAVARHKRTPIDVLRSLAQENLYKIWSGLASNPHTPIDIIERMIATNHVDLWFRISNHPTMIRHQKRPFLELLLKPLHELVTKSRPPIWFQRAVLQYSISLPAAVLEPFAYSAYWQERYLAARHPQIDEAILKMLAHDGIYYVRAMANDMLKRRNIDTSTASL